ncbi:MAG TPA: 16S rRNA (uracil(1498)-N(3))-methyltransferase [Chloroflexia bacterium]|nr:16S rRNA (uracil(1498)-N(3))-methyltransferase [Chloroflexia bacterium]
MQRFFVDLPTPLTPGAELHLPAPLTHQLGHVLRGRPGDRIVLLDNSGDECEVELTSFGRGTIHGRVLARRPGPADPGPRVVLYACVLKGDRFSWVLQKATELGVAAIVPVISARTVAGGAPEGGGKQARWAQVVREAAEQSRRSRLPDLAAAVAWPAAVAQAARADVALVPWEEAPSDATAGPLLQRARAALQVALLIGPEGGLTAEEVDLAARAGVVPVSLGPRILRAETAAVAALALLLIPR